MATVTLFVLVLLFTSPVVRSQKGRDALMDLKPRQSTTPCYTLPNFQQLFIESCLMVLSAVNNVNETCQMTWEAFSGAFAYKNPLEVDLDDYDEYFDLLQVKSEQNSVVFWSGVPSLIEKISKTTEISISTSFTQDASNIINNMAKYPSCWCGGPNGINYTNPCPDQPSTSFWAKFSCELGESASGISFWIGNGEREGGTFRPNSFFTEYELVKLNPPDDIKLVVVEVSRMDIGEKCGDGTLADLENLAVQKFGEEGYTCYDVNGNVNDPDELMELSDEVLEIIGVEQGNGIVRVIHVHLIVALSRNVCIPAYLT